MERNEKSRIMETCNVSGARPAMTALPYPPMEVKRRNQDYADLLSNDYCGQVSELGAVTQYINNETRLLGGNCSFARVLLQIAMAEMMHLQKLGELISLLGGEISFAARQPGGKEKLWTPAYLTLPENPRAMLCADIESEKEAICQYKKHISMIKDECVDATLARIIDDEEYHIMLLQSMLKEL